MPRGGARPGAGSGGKRPGAGRKKGSTTKRTRKTNELAAAAAGEGALPLQVLLEAMRHFYERRQWAKAAAIATQAAPYVHPRLASVQHGGKLGVALEVVEEIVEGGPLGVVA
jgi:hypothetical protein